MKLTSPQYWQLAVLLNLALLVSPLQAALTSSGDVEPIVNIWNSSTSAYIGKTNEGSLLLDGGSSLISGYTYLGHTSSATGTAEISGLGTVWTSSGNVYVGQAGNGTLNINNGGQLEDSSGYVGYSAGSVGSVIVTGANSKWKNNVSLYIGYRGSGNLLIENGALVTGDSNYLGSSRSNYLGFLEDSAGSVTVTGTGSRWDNVGALYVGKEGQGSLTVSDDALVATDALFASLTDLHGDGLITIRQGAVLDADLSFNSLGGPHATSSFGSGGTMELTVDGGDLGVGYKQSGSLSVADGVILASKSGILGSYATADGTAIVSGPGTQWNMVQNISIGSFGSGNLTISAGAVVSDSSAYVAHSAGGIGTVLVTGAGARWENRGALIVAHSGNGSLSIEAGGQVTDRTGGVGMAAGALGTAKVSGTDSVWTHTEDFSVGSSGVASVLIEAGGRINNRNATLGNSATGAGAVTVTGTGSQWLNSGDLFIGKEGSGSLTVERGGEVFAAKLYGSISDLHGNGNIEVSQGAVLDGDLHFDASQDTQSTMSFGSGGTLTINANGGVLGSGYKGSGLLTMSNGASLNVETGYLGYYESGEGSAIVTGAGSQWNNTGPLYIGKDGHGILTIENGASVTSSTSQLGSSADAMGTAIVTGSESNWTSGVLNVGMLGKGILTISDGGKVDSQGENYVGWSSGSSGSVVVRGTESVWNIGIRLFIGNQGNGSLEVDSGGLVTSDNAYLGNFNSGVGTASVTGAGSKWIVSDSLYVGERGEGILTVNDGGIIRVGSLYASLNDIHGNGTIEVTKGGVFDGELRFDTPGESQAIVPFGNGGILSINANGGELGAGYKSSGSIIVSNGAVVTSTGQDSLGYQSGSTGSATITGSGSSWSTSDLIVGHTGKGQLKIEAGGYVSSQRGILGWVPEASGSALVTDLDSQWKINDVLHVGCYDECSLTIENGGHVSNAEGYVGYYYPGIVTIRGDGSEWINTDGLYIGHQSESGTMIIEDGGKVVSAEAHLIPSATHFPYANSTALVIGAGSQWINDGSMILGYSLSPATILVRDGGRVTTASIGIWPRSRISIEVSNGSHVLIDGTITNFGGFEFIAGPTATSGDQFSPFSAESWSGGYYTLGGTWNVESFIFTASEIISGASGSPIALDLTQDQRVLVQDDSRALYLGASLLAKSGSPRPISFTATSLLDPLPGRVLGAWDVDITGIGYTPNDPLYLSFSITPGLTRNDLSLWYFHDSEWIPYEVDDLTVSGGYASFTTSRVGGYALTLAGDFNGDGLFTGADFLAWQRNPNLGDLTDWRHHYPLTNESSPGSTLVPEPSTWILAMIALIGFIFSVRTREFAEQCSKK